MRVKTAETGKIKTQMRVVLAGNPNAGKTTLFNALTRSSLRTGNFHGVTTTAAEKRANGVTYVDSPGLYAMNAYSMEESNAADAVNGASVIVNVLDALTLENSLNLTRRLIATGKPVAVYITKLNQLKKRGGSLDKDKLSAHLGVPVFVCSAKQLKKQIESGINFSVSKKDIPFNNIYRAGREGVSKADKLFYNPYFASFFFVASIALMFFLAFHPIMPGALLKNLTETLIVDKLGSALTSLMSNEILISLVKDGILGGAGSVLSFIPQLAVLYLFLTLLDESGLMSALSFATDGLFEKVKLSGRAAFSRGSGVGCRRHNDDKGVFYGRGAKANYRNTSLYSLRGEASRISDFFIPAFQKSLPRNNSFVFCRACDIFIDFTFIKGRKGGYAFRSYARNFPFGKYRFKKVVFLPQRVYN